MKTDDLSRISEAFSRKALIYDDFGTGHPNLERMRQKVREQALETMPAGGSLLEINAGTGADAAYFASRGFHVHATDVAPGMLAQIQNKIEQYGLHERLTVQQCSFTELERVSGGPYDSVLSNMGGVNCIRDLTRITQGLERLLVPGGSVTWVVMPPICPWELAQGLRGDFKLAFRRLRRGGVLSNVEGVQFMTYYFTPRQVQQAFGPRFHRLRLQGLSVFTPPADHKEFAIQRPRLYRWLCALDDRLSGLSPFNGWGDFFILTMRYQP